MEAQSQLRKPLANITWTAREFTSVRLTAKGAKSGTSHREQERRDRETVRLAMILRIADCIGTGEELEVASGVGWTACRVF